VNPFTTTFRTLEFQLKQRRDIAEKYGFDLVEIEKIAGEDRAKAVKETLEKATGGIKTLLRDLTIGSGATGSATERLAGLASERDRLAGLFLAGDTSQADALADVVAQIDNLQREVFGATGGFANLDAATLPRVRALRIGLVTRSPQAEKPNAAGVCEATTAMPALFGEAVTADVTDWRCYRYRTAVAVVPLRNLVMGLAP
jgi:hypothetical protein